jgi:hypothetical protein
MNLAKSAAQAALQAVLDLHNGGTLKVYSGTQPATPEDALSGNTELVSFDFSATAFGAQSFASGNQQAVASFAAASKNPDASGTASFARAFQSDGATVIADYSVGTSGTDLTIGNTSVQVGTNVDAALTLKTPAV